MDFIQKYFVRVEFTFVKNMFINCRMNMHTLSVYQIIVFIFAEFENADTLLISEVQMLLEHR